MARRRVSRIAAAVALAALVAGGLAVAPALPAAAASDDVLVSADGQHWVPSLNDQLFAGFGALVPGDGQHADLWIKNNSSYTSTMRIGITELDIPSEIFARGVTLTTTGRASDLDQKWNVGDLDNCKVVIPTAQLKPGETVKMGLTFTMLDLDGLAAQGETAKVDFVVKMRDVRGGVYPTDPCDDKIIAPASADSGDGSLPFTGQGIRTDLIIAAAMLVGIGWFLIVFRRRRREDKADDATLSS